MKKLYCLVLIIVSFTFVAKGQKAYYTTKTAVSTGVNLINGGSILNAKYCQVKKGENITKYTPEEVLEYKLNNKQVYKSFEVNLNGTISHYFLERIIDGKAKLYYLLTEDGVKRYFLTRNDNSDDLVEIPSEKEKYDSLFKNYFSDHSQTVENTRYIKLEKSKLSNFVKEYNQSSKRPFPRFRYGVTVGMSSTAIASGASTSMYSAMKTTSNQNFSIGIFADFPIFPGHFSIHPELYYKQNKYSTSFVFTHQPDRDGIPHGIKTSHNDLNLSYSSLSLPILLRYNFSGRTISPYLQAGPVYSQILKNKTTLVMNERRGGNPIGTIIDTNPALPNSMGGFSVGGGIILKYGSKFSVFGEVGYGEVYSMGSKKLLNLHETSLKIGIIF